VPGAVPAAPVDNNEFYDVLGVDKNVDRGELKKRYRKLAMKHHPDRGGDPDTFKKINQAYDVLYDTKKRKAYDRGGKAAVEGTGDNPQSSANDIFSSFFRRAEPEDEGPRKGKPLVHEVQVPLEELYNGRKRKFRISRTRIEVPEGLSKEDACAKCQECDGRGVLLKTVRAGNMVQQMQVHCNACVGGWITKPGVKEKRDKSIFEVHVEPGMRDGAQIKMDSEGDEKPGMLPGDLVFVLRETPHEVFKRKGNDLLVHKKIQLSEALCGVRFSLQTLDGRELVVATDPGTVVRHQQVMCVEGEGMPFHGNPFTRGRLFVLFELEMPASGSLSPQQLAILRTVLPAGDPCAPTDDAEACTLAPVDVAQFGRSGHGEGGGPAYDSDDDEHGAMPRGVQCAQQ